MKLILTYPNQRWQKFDVNTTWDLNPVTLMLLASVVKDIADVEILDAHFHDMTIEKFKEELSNKKPDVVGISVMTSEYHDILNITADAVKEVSNNIHVIAGGVHVTTNTSLVMKNQNIDFGVLGEGEDTLRGILLYLQGKGDLPSVGFAFREDINLVNKENSLVSGKSFSKGATFSENKRLVNRGPALVDDLTKLPWPSYDLVDYSKYITAHNRKGPNRPPAFPAFRTIVTRGCSFGCTFCQVELISGKKTRSRDPEDVVNELIYLKENYGIKSIVFEDDNMLMADGGRFAKKLFQIMIDKKVDLPWIGTAFALFLLTDKLIDLMAASGCVGINVAIESGTERVLKQIVKKPIKDLNEVPKIIKRIQDRGMYCFANFIIGFPGETWEEIRETFNFADKAGADYSRFFVAVPLKGTELFDMAQQSGMLMCNDDYIPVDWRYGQIHSDEWTAQDISILRVYEWDRINFKPEKIQKMADLWGVSIEELNKIRKATRDTLDFS